MAIGNQEGKKRYEVEIIAEQVDFLTPKGNNSQTKVKDEWDELGGEVNIEDIGMGEETPF